MVAWRHNNFKFSDFAQYPINMHYAIQSSTTIFRSQTFSTIVHTFGFKILHSIHTTIMSFYTKCIFMKSAFICHKYLLFKEKPLLHREERLSCSFLIAIISAVSCVANSIIANSNSQINIINRTNNLFSDLVKCRYHFAIFFFNN